MLHPRLFFAKLCSSITRKPYRPLSSQRFISSSKSTKRKVMNGHDESLIEQAKRRAAYKAVDEHIPPDAKVVGIGSGSTVTYVVERIVQRGQELNKGVVFVPTSFQSRQLIIQNGLNLGDVDAYPEIDVTIDGADEVDDNLNCIKGGGACHLREKVVAEAAKKFVIVADSRKNSSILCQKWKKGIPIEVIPFAYSRVVIGLKKLGCKNPALRIAVAKAGPIITDNGNFIIDADFGQLIDPVELLHKIKLLTGVVEVGIFVDVVQFAYFGNEDGTVTEKKKEW